VTESSDPVSGLTPAVVEPRRAFEWPDIVEVLARQASPLGQLYLVGGTVRDALLGYPVHDIDIATPLDGLAIARELADSLGGAYYPVDRERQTGRVRVTHGGEDIIIDVASFRADGLSADLAWRDFTINAMATPLDDLDALIDPLGGQADLFDRRVIRQCRPDSVERDPIRALRAVRQSLQFRLTITPETTAAIRKAVPTLTTDGRLNQPERVRDEVFKTLVGGKPAAALRALNALGALDAITPYPLPPQQALAERIAVVARLQDLFDIIGAGRDDNTAADLMLGIAVMVLDRYRRQLQEHIGRKLADGRPLTALLHLGALTPPEIDMPGKMWGGYLRLSNAEEAILDALAEARRTFPAERPVGRREAHRYFRGPGESGVSGVLLALAEQLSHQPAGEADPEGWSVLLTEAAAPLLEAMFREHQQIIAPPPLVDGRDLIRQLGIEPGPQVGALLKRLLEEQAAGVIQTKKEALDLAERLLKTGDTDG
jgi:poly(A) polymerase